MAWKGHYRVSSSLCFQSNFSLFFILGKFYYSTFHFSGSFLCVLLMRWAFQNGCYLCLYPHSESQLPPAFLGGSRRSASEPEPGSWSVWNFVCICPGSWSVWNFACICYEWNLHFPQPSGSPESKPHWPSKPNIMGTCLSGAGPLGWVLYVGLGPLTPWGEPLQL